MILILRCFLSVAKTVKFRRMSSTTSGSQHLAHGRARRRSAATRSPLSASRQGAHSSSGIWIEPNRYSLPSVANEKTLGTNICGHVVLVVVVDLVRAVDPA